VNDGLTWMFTWRKWLSPEFVKPCGVSGGTISTSSGPAAISRPST
jgi:hypothetical protein